MKQHDPGKSTPTPLPTEEKQSTKNQIVSTIKGMQLAFDAAKSERNARERDLPFTQVEHFDFETAHYQIDDRIEYPEMRIVALGLLRQRLHVLCFTPIDNGIRVISFRKANSREIRDYEKARSVD